MGSHTVLFRHRKQQMVFHHQLSLLPDVYHHRCEVPNRLEQNDEEQGTGP